MEPTNTLLRRLDIVMQANSRKCYTRMDITPDLLQLHLIRISWTYQDSLLFRLPTRAIIRLSTTVTLIWQQFEAVCEPSRNLMT